MGGRLLIMVAIVAAIHGDSWPLGNAFLMKSHMSSILSIARENVMLDVFSGKHSLVSYARRCIDRFDEIFWMIKRF